MKGRGDWELIVVPRDGTDLAHPNCKHASS
jgi:hypothetical protein